MIKCIPVCCCCCFFFVSLSSVLLAVNLLVETLIILRPKEHKDERNTLTDEIDIEQINFHADSKEISEMFDFVQLSTGRSECIFFDPPTIGSALESEEQLEQRKRHEEIVQIQSSCRVLDYGKTMANLFETDDQFYFEDGSFVFR